MYSLTDHDGRKHLLGDALFYVTASYSVTNKLRHASAIESFFFSLSFSYTNILVGEQSIDKACQCRAVHAGHVLLE